MKRPAVKSVAFIVLWVSESPYSTSSSSHQHQSAFSTLILYYHFLPAYDIDALPRLVDAFAIKGEYRTIVILSIYNMAYSRFVHFYDFLEFFPVAGSQIGFLAALRNIQCCICPVWVKQIASQFSLFAKNILF